MEFRHINESKRVRHELHDQVQQRPDHLSLDDCLDSIVFYAKRLREDTSSTMCNSMKITSLQSCLNLYSEYNKALSALELK